MSETRRGISRRTLVKGTAWAVPAVAVASAAPAMAASGTVTFENLSSACKLPGASCQGQTGVKKGYVVAVQVCNTVTGNPGNVTVTFAEQVNGALCGNTKAWNIKPNPLVLTQSGCSTVYLALDGEPDSANCAINGSTTFTWEAENGLTGSGELTFSAPATPPCDNCRPPAATPAALAPATEELLSENTPGEPAPQSESAPATEAAPQAEIDPQAEAQPPAEATSSNEPTPQAEPTS